MVCAMVSVLAVAIITILYFLYWNSRLFEIGVFKFIFGTDWSPAYADGGFGILPMIFGSVYATAGAIIIGVPVGLFTAVMLSRVAPTWLVGILRPAVELLPEYLQLFMGFLD